MEMWLKKRAELADGLARAEALWLEAVERLEAADAPAETTADEAR
jgi:ATP-binding cassette, subfamily F, member 3